MINNFQIVDVDGIVVSEIIPAREFDVIVDVNVSGGAIKNLRDVEIKLWYDEDGNNYNEEDFNARTQASITSCAIISWTYDGDNEITVEMKSSENSSWELDQESSKLPSIEFLQNEDNSEFEFKFRIKIGKIARETIGDARWQIGVMVTNEDDGKGYEYIKNNQEEGVLMDWYGEVVGLPESVDWGNIPLGINFDEPEAKVTAAGIKFISNGTFDYGVKISSPWVSEDDDEVTGSPNAEDENEFAIRVDTNENFSSDTAKQINFDEAEVDVIDTEIIASENEEGKEFINYFYIKVNEQFPQAKAFNGNITYTITRSIN